MGNADGDNQQSQVASRGPSLRNRIKVINSMRQSKFHINIISPCLIFYNITWLLFPIDQSQTCLEPPKNVINYISYVLFV